MGLQGYLPERQSIILENPGSEKFLDQLESYLEGRTVVVTDSYVRNGFLEGYEGANKHPIDQKDLTSRSVDMAQTVEYLEGHEDAKLTYVMEAPSGVKNMLLQDWREICVFIDYMGTKISSGFQDRVEANALYLTSEDCWSNNIEDYNLLKHTADDLLNVEEYMESLEVQKLISEPL